MSLTAEKQIEGKTLPDSRGNIQPPPTLTAAGS